MRKIYALRYIPYGDGGGGAGFLPMKSGCQYSAIGPLEPTPSVRLFLIPFATGKPNHHGKRWTSDRRTGVIVLVRHTLQYPIFYYRI